MLDGSLVVTGLSPDWLTMILVALDVCRLPEASIHRLLLGPGRGGKAERSCP